MEVDFGQYTDGIVKHLSEGTPQVEGYSLPKPHQIIPFFNHNDNEPLEDAIDEPCLPETDN